MVSLARSPGLVLPQAIGDSEQGEKDNRELSDKVNCVPDVIPRSIGRGVGPSRLESVTPDTDVDEE